jgi:hypothetical protein
MRTPFLSFCFQEERLLNLSQATDNEIRQTEEVEATRTLKMLVHRQNATSNNPKDYISTEDTDRFISLSLALSLGNKEADTAERNVRYGGI